MVDQPPEMKTAVSLMRMALAQLDRSGALHPAAHLQWAIDVATDQPAMKPADKLDPELLERFFPDLGRSDHAVPDADTTRAT